MSKDRWERHGSAIRQWALAADFDSPWGARGVIQTLARYINGCLDEELPMRPDVVFDRARIEYWTSQYPGARRSASTHRSRLRRVAQGLAPSWGPPPPVLEDKVAVKPPYTPEEVARFWSAVDAQSSPRRSQALAAVLTFGLGAGLRTRELVALRRHHVLAYPSINGLIAVHLPDRIVPIWEDTSVRASELIARLPQNGWVLTGGPQPLSKDPLGHAMKGVELPPGSPPLLLSRLRTTWAVALLSKGIRLSEYIKASGAQGGRTLAFLASYVPVRSDDDYLRAVAGLESSPADQD